MAVSPPLVTACCFAPYSLLLTLITQSILAKTMVRWGLGAVRTLCGGASELADWKCTSTCLWRGLSESVGGREAGL